MAINLNFQAAPVSNFATENPAAAGGRILNVGRAVSGVIGQAQEVHEQWLALRDEREVQGFVSDYERAETEYIEQLDNKFYYSGDELEGTDYDGDMYQLAEDGSEIPKSIPAWEAEPYLKKRNANQTLENAASRISNYQLRQKIISEGRKKIEDSFQSDLLNAIKIGREQLRFETTRNLEEMMRTGDHSEAVDLIGASSVFTNEEKAELKNDIEVNSEYFGVRNITVKPYWGVREFIEAQSEIERLGDDGYAGPLSQEDRIKLINELKSRMDLENQRLKGEKNKENLGFKMETWERIQNKDGTIDASFLLDANHKGLINDTTTFTFYKASLENYIEELELTERKARVIQQAALGFGVDPHNKDNRETVNQIFKDDYDRLVEMKTELGEPVTQADYVRTALATARNYKIVPGDVVSQLLGADREDSVALKEAALLYNEFRAVAPASMDDIDGDQFSIVASVAAGIDAGMAPEEAIIAAREMDDKSNQYIDDVYRELTRSTKNNPTALSEDLLTRVKDDPELEVPFTVGGQVAEQPVVGYPIGKTGLPFIMEKEYETLFMRYLYSSGGNVRIAKQKAFNTIKSQWSLTDINQPDFDAGAEFYGVDTTSKWSFGARGYQYLPFSPDRGDTSGLTSAQMRFDIQNKFSSKLKEGERLQITADHVTLDKGQAGRKVDFPILGVKGDEVQYLGRWAFDSDEVAESWNQVAKERRDIDIGAKIKQLERMRLNEERQPKAWKESDTKFWGP